jgi:Protein of unknown function (DUF3995)
LAVLNSEYGALASMRNLPALAAAALAFASAAVTAFWLLGGTLGLDTVGGEIERQARERSAAALAVLAITLVAKLAAGGLALALADSRMEGKRSLITLGIVGGAGLALYGGVLVIAGALALAGVGDSSGRDEYALRWHVFFWDPWFFVWGVALALAAVRARRKARASADAGVHRGRRPANPSRDADQMPPRPDSS